MKKKVLVTGAGGYIGSWVCKGLLEKGYDVTGTVRSLKNTAKFAHLESLASQHKGRIDIVEADLLDKKAFFEPLKNCDAVIHVASPFTLRFKDAQKDLIDPALEGTRNVLQAANASEKVKKVVLTSSVAAIYGDAVDMKEQGLSTFTEEQFNTTSSISHQPYSYSKVLAEKEAWKIAEQQNIWKLVVINPSFVMGPALASSTDSESMEFMRNLLSGKLSFGAPELYFGFVDVRDVAQAHIEALEREDAEGRHIISGENAKVLDLAAVIEKAFPGEYKLPKSNAPKWLLFLVGRFFGASPSFVKRNVGHPLSFDNQKSIQKLGMAYRSLGETVVDMVKNFKQKE